ncbi:MAG: hypothetical protein HC808_16915 [Candidatus Competibacteraceae bacterium]|nr:hypothetical protein [Candidatus Competibacteraceae bacterium]
MSWAAGDVGDDNAAPTKPTEVLLQTVEVGEHTAQFYIGYGPDVAVLGFSVPNQAAQKRYFPLYGSTYAGIPPVTLEVFVSQTENEMWVNSSWSGYEVLAYHRLGTEQCITRFGEIESFEEPVPQAISGESKDFPPMDPAQVSKVATIEYGE